MSQDIPQVYISIIVYLVTVDAKNEWKMTFEQIFYILSESVRLR